MRDMSLLNNYYNSNGNDANSEQSEWEIIKYDRSASCFVGFQVTNTQSLAKPRDSMIVVVVVVRNFSELEAVISWT